jgi:hypothetical protein
MQYETWIGAAVRRTAARVKGSRTAGVGQSGRIRVAAAEPDRPTIDMIPLVNCPGQIAR